MTWPLAQQLSTHFPSPDTDVFNLYWSNWWFRHAIATGQNPYFTDYLLYPIGFDTITFGFSPLLALLWLPLSWFLPALAAFNLVFLVTIVLCCLAMDQLMRYLTGNAWAALVAGITFGFAPSLAAERLPHLSKTALFWIPWALLLLTRLLREARVRDAILLAATMGLAFLTLPQVGVPVVMACVIFLLGLAAVEYKRWHRLAFRRLALASLLGLLVMSPFLIFGWQVLKQPGGDYLLRGGAELSQTDLLAYLVPPQANPILGSLELVTEAQRFVMAGQYWVYLGLIPILLLFYAAVRRPREALPWLLTGAVFFVLALGPYLRFNGRVFPAIKLPYSLAPKLFSAMGFDTPNRFNMAMMAPVSVLVGLACADLYSRIKKPWLPGLVALLILGEYLVVPLPTVPAPAHSAFYDRMAVDGEEYAIVDLPLTRPAGEVHRYYLTIHHKPIVGGWVRRVPATAFDFIKANSLLAPWMENGAPTDFSRQPPQSLDEALAGLSEANVRYIVIHKDQLTNVPESTRALLGALRPIYQDDSISVLPVESTSDDGYNVVQWFGKDLGLIRPTAFLDRREDGQPTLLSLHICWVGDDARRRADGTGAVPAPTTDRVQVTLTSPDGSLVYEETALLPDASTGLACENRRLDIAPHLQAGEYTLAITPVATASSAEQTSGTYTTMLPIQMLPLMGRELFPAMGSSCYMPFGAAIELLGYNLMEGEGFVWIDLFWRSTATHQRTYDRDLHFVDPDTGQRIAELTGPIQKGAWQEGELFEERMILWLDHGLPERAQLGLALDGTEITGGCRADLLVEQYIHTLPPGEHIYLSPVLPALLPSQDHPNLRGYDGRACLVAPARTQGDTTYVIMPAEDPNSMGLLRTYFPKGEIAAEGPQQGQQPSFLAFHVAEDSTAEIAPSHPLEVRWGDKIQLLGYDLDATSYKPGESVHLTFYYRALEVMDADYTVFVHLVGPVGQASGSAPRAQDDSEPCRRSYPTSVWIPGEIVRDEIVIAIPEDVPAGDYQLKAGFYLFETMVRLPATDATGLAIPDDAVWLEQLSVGSSTQP